MTRIAYFQPFSGASGDMAMGALVDVGLGVERLTEGLRSLGLPGWQLTAQKELRGPFQTTRLRVVIDGQPGTRGGSEHGHEHRPDDHHHGHGHPSHEHAHEHGHSHDRRHDPGHEHTHPHASAPTRGLSQILELIDRSSLPPEVKTSSARVFQRLGEAEAKVHGIPVEKVHFHEVGAIDSIVDITGTCLGLHLLGIDEVHSAPLTVGTGFVKGAHGTIPLPAPATLEILRGFPVEHRDSQAELTTPTGAALLTTLARSFGTMPPLVVSAVGYGAGDDRPGPIPNALRVIVGELASRLSGDRVVVLETNIDDMSGEWLGHLLERLLEAGALDASVTPIVMKKSRPAHEFKVIAPLAAEAAITRVLFAESTTLGLRRSEVDRVVLARELRPIETPWGTVRVKIGKMGEEVVTASPEYEDLRAAALRAKVPLKEMHARVMALYSARG